MISITYLLDRNFQSFPVVVSSSQMLQNFLDILVILYPDRSNVNAIRLKRFRFAFRRLDLMVDGRRFLQLPEPPVLLMNHFVISGLFYLLYSIAHLLDQRPGDVLVSQT